MSPACDGCLGTTECWICVGDGCSRCASTGICHLCSPRRLAQLIPVQEPHPAALERPQGLSTP